MTYYTYNEQTKQLAAAPRTIRDGGRTIIPNAKRYAAMGAYPLSDTIETVSPPEGKIAVPDGYELQSGKWTRTYRYEDAPPPPPRTFSKYKLVRALQAENVWDAVKSWLQSREGAWDLYLAAEDISEDERLLADGIVAVKQLLGWTDEQIAAVLDAVVIGGAS